MACFHSVGEHEVRISPEHAPKLVFRFGAFVSCSFAAKHERSPEFLGVDVPWLSSAPSASRRFKHGDAKGADGKNGWTIQSLENIQRFETGH